MRQKTPLSYTVVVCARARVNSHIIQILNNTSSLEY